MKGGAQGADRQGSAPSLWGAGSKDPSFGGGVVLPARTAGRREAASLRESEVVMSNGRHLQRRVVSLSPLAAPAGGEGRGAWKGSRGHRGRRPPPASRALELVPLWRSPSCGCAWGGVTGNRDWKPTLQTPSEGGGGLAVCPGWGASVGGMCRDSPVPTLQDSKSF